MPLEVLLAEDEPMVRTWLADEFTDLGWQVIEAADGEEALQEASQPRKFDLLLTDIRMPGGIDGWELARRVRAIDPDVPVIYATGFSEETCDLVSGSRLLAKPYRFSEIISAMRDLGLEV